MTDRRPHGATVVTAVYTVTVDIPSRKLSFFSPHENRESDSCAAVTARPQSRLGMQLTIQTDTTSLTKNIHFLSTEDRTDFSDALAMAKTNTDLFTLLPGEAVLEHIQRVTNLVVMSQSDRAVQSVLKITTYRITVSPYDSSWKFGSFEVPLSALDVITRDGLMLLISCKDLRTIRLAMHDAYTKKKGYDQLPSTPDFRWLNALVQRMRPPNIIGTVFAFDYHAEKESSFAARPARGRLAAVLTDR